jgi:hypothetical protein
MLKSYPFSHELYNKQFSKKPLKVISPKGIDHSDMKDILGPGSTGLYSKESNEKPEWIVHHKGTHLHVYDNGKGLKISSPADSSASKDFVSHIKDNHSDKIRYRGTAASTIGNTNQKDFSTHYQNFVDGHKTGNLFSVPLTPDQTKSATSQFFGKMGTHFVTYSPGEGKGQHKFAIKNGRLVGFKGSEDHAQNFIKNHLVVNTNKERKMNIKENTDIIVLTEDKYEYAFRSGKDTLKRFTLDEELSVMASFLSELFLYKGKPFRINENSIITYSKNAPLVREFIREVLLPKCDSFTASDLSSLEENLKTTNKASTDYIKLQKQVKYLKTKKLVREDNEDNDDKTFPPPKHVKIPKIRRISKNLKL